MTLAMENRVAFCAPRSIYGALPSSILGARDPNERQTDVYVECVGGRDLFQIKMWFRRAPRFSPREYKVRNEQKLLP